LGRRSVRTIKTDDALRIDVGALRAALEEDARAGIHPVAIVATAGTVNTGAIDPIAPLLEIARERGIWLHVDGAYGAFGVLDARAGRRGLGGAPRDRRRRDARARDAAPRLRAPRGGARAGRRAPRGPERAGALDLLLPLPGARPGRGRAQRTECPHRAAPSG